MICTTDTILSLSLLWAWVWSKVQSVQKNMKILLSSTQPNQIFLQDNATNQLLINSYKNPDFRKLFVFLSIFIVLQAHQNFNSISSHVPSLTGNLLPVDPSRSHRLHTHSQHQRDPQTTIFLVAQKKMLLIHIHFPSDLPQLVDLLQSLESFLQLFFFSQKHLVPIDQSPGES